LCVSGAQRGPNKRGKPPPQCEVKTDCVHARLHVRTVDMHPHPHTEKHIDTANNPLAMRAGACRLNMQRGKLLPVCVLCRCVVWYVASHGVASHARESVHGLLRPTRRGTESKGLVMSPLGGFGECKPSQRQSPVTGKPWVSAYQRTRGEGSHDCHAEVAWRIGARAR